MCKFIRKCLRFCAQTGKFLSQTRKLEEKSGEKLAKIAKNESFFSTFLLTLCANERAGEASEWMRG